MSMKNSNDTIGNQTRDLRACSAVPQPTGPPRTPSAFHCVIIMDMLKPSNYCLRFYHVSKFISPYLQIAVAIVTYVILLIQFKPLGN